MSRVPPRTFLAELIWKSNLTVEETVRAFNCRAREINSNATISERHLRRLMAGQRTSVLASTRRVMEALFEVQFDKLLGPPGGVAELVPATAAMARPFTGNPPVGGAEPLATAARLSLDEELLMAAEDSARFVRRAGAVLTSEVLQQLEADVVLLAEQYMRRPPYMMFRPLAALRREVFDMLEGHPRPEHARDLYRIAGLLSSLLAHLSSDLGHPYAVDTHTRTAWLCADLSGDDYQRAYIRWVQSQVAYWQHDYQRSAELAREGQNYAPAGGGMLRLASQEARALAALGDVHGTDAALLTAGSALEVAVDQQPAPGVFYFAPGKAAYYSAEAHLALGGPDRLRSAVVDAEKSLALFDSGHGSSPELIAAAQLDLVTAHIGLNDLDSGAEHLAAVLQLPVESRTVPVVERTAKIARSLRRGAFLESRPASELRDQLDQFVAYPAARELPQLPA